MEKKTYCILLLGIIIFLYSCNQRSGIEYSDAEHLLNSLKKEKGTEYNKLPPRLVKAFLRYDGSTNPHLQQLLEISKLFIVVHIPKNEEKSIYNLSKNELKFLVQNMAYNKLNELEINDIMFRQFFKTNETKYNELVLEIDEPALYTIYCLKGEFTSKDIEEVSNNVSPIEFLKLNKKIRRN